MQVRKAILEDASQVIDLFKQFQASEWRSNLDDCVETFKQVIEYPELGSVLVADDDGELLGVLTLSFPTAIRFNGIYSSIEEFIVTERSRGKGVGGGLLKAAIAEATARGCYELQVNNPSEMGYPVYIQNGFKDIGKHLAIRTKS
jgi:GNAT superfamily N-acetyltransferase